jgi:hypothetical protein
MALFIRFFVICFGIFLGSVASGATFLATSESFSADFNMPYGDFYFWAFIGATLTWSTIFFFWSSLPILIAVFITEAFSLRSALIYAVAGGIGGALYGVGFLTGIPNAIQSAAAAGIVGGLVYWLVAGRNAGAWRGAAAAAPSSYRPR